MRIIRHIRNAVGQDDPPNDLETEMASMSNEQLLEFWQAINEELSYRSRYLPFQSIGDYRRTEILALNLGHIEDELDRRNDKE